MTIRLNHFAISADLGSMVGGRVQTPHGAFASSAITPRVQSLVKAAAAERNRLFQIEAAAAKFDSFVQAAFRQTAEGYSVDRVIADPALNRRFLEVATGLGLEASPIAINRALFRLRKTGKLSDRTASRRTIVQDQWRFAYASEVAARVLFFQTRRSVDSVLCDPDLAERFDEIAGALAPGFTPFEYRWAALNNRKKGMLRSVRAAAIEAFDWDDIIPYGQDVGRYSEEPGVYALIESDEVLYVGQTEDVAETVEAASQIGSLDQIVDGLWKPDPRELRWMLSFRLDGSDLRSACVNELVSIAHPIFNIPRGSSRVA